MAVMAMRRTRSATLVLVVALALVVALGCAGCGSASVGPSASSSASGATNAVPSAGDQAVASAFRDRRSEVPVAGQGVVERVLADDNDGSRHQRFILRLASGQTLLIAHNIDIAPRLEGLKPGDTVAFSGIYEYNAQGGVVHWTHHDPGGKHTAGWLQANGQTVQ
jgi:ABC-type glycerol-3-phosphate transport system substrate-binding protein